MQWNACGALAGLSQAQLEEKAKEIWQWLYRLESEKYDLEQRNKRQRDDLTELAERARQITKGGYSLLTSSPLCLLLKSMCLSPSLMLSPPLPLAPCRAKKAANPRQEPSPYAFLDSTVLIYFKSFIIQCTVC